jgi:hypothetical protein
MLYGTDIDHYRYDDSAKCFSVIHHKRRCRRSPEGTHDSRHER